MAEFPHLGKNCDAEFCNQLDFLPIKCDSCQGFFCTTHFTYDEHNCPQAHRKNVQVPICPMCTKPVPTPRGIPIDYQVNEHIQNNCEIVKKQKIYNNRCTVKGCKKKELMPITCPTCSQNYCLRHRHEKDHNCEEFLQANPERRGYFARAFAALSIRNNAPNDCSSQARNLQIANDEQVARALENDEYNEVEIESAANQRQRQQRSSQQRNCSVS